VALDIEMREDILRIRLHETVSQQDLTHLADEVLALEARVEPVPDRLSDLTAAAQFEVGFSDFHELTLRRRTSHLPNDIRSAILVATEVQFGLARMFQTLNDHPRVTVEIFRDLSEALAWVSPRAE
jgi:hypothetical protein